MKTRKTVTLVIAVLIATSLSTSIWAETMPTDSIGGKPPAGSKVSVKDLDYQVKCQTDDSQLGH